MGPFDFFFTLYGLVLGLSVASLAGGFASAIRKRAHRRPSHLTLLLGLFVLLDIASFWMWGWAVRQYVTVTWALMYGGLVTSVIYFTAASLVFPTEGEHWEAPDDHYWKQKRIVFGGVLLANLLSMSFEFRVLPPRLGDWLFWFYQGLYFVPLTALIFNRGRRTEFALLGWLIVWYVIVAFDMLPKSHWGAAHAGIW